MSRILVIKVFAEVFVANWNERIELVSVSLLFLLKLPNHTAMKTNSGLQHLKSFISPTSKLRRKMRTIIDFKTHSGLTGVIRK